MAVNRYQPHLVVYCEDRPYREILNGVKTLAHVNSVKLDARPPCGGWVKVFHTFEENIPLLKKYAKMHTLLLMDFDNDFQARHDRFMSLSNACGVYDRSFVLGIDKKESEDLARTMRQPSKEALAEPLLKGCPEQDSPVWQNQHLVCNMPELQRMRKTGLFEWLFW